MRVGEFDRAFCAARPQGPQAQALEFSRLPPSSQGSEPLEPLFAEVAPGASREICETDLLRSYEYGLLASVLLHVPDRELLACIAALEGDMTPLGRAHSGLAEAAACCIPEALQREFFDLFIGVGRGELLPYASYYLTGFLSERPLARLREDLAKIGLQRAEDLNEPEDHIGFLCELMAGLTSGALAAPPGADKLIFERHLKPWAMRFFADLEASRSAGFYRSVGAIGRLFMQIEAEALAMD